MRPLHQRGLLRITFLPLSNGYRNSHLLHLRFRRNQALLTPSSLTNSPLGPPFKSQFLPKQRPPPFNLLGSDKQPPRSQSHSRRVSAEKILTLQLMNNASREVLNLYVFLRESAPLSSARVLMADYQKRKYRGKNLAIRSSAGWAPILNCQKRK